MRFWRDIVALEAHDAEKLSEKLVGMRWSAGFSRLKPALQRQFMDFSDSL
ncbi:hypothetical protein [Candidatus Viridilinea mediisalina]|nr:hypothetical protein [Candidatus Viridilinea mediisalina]